VGAVVAAVLFFVFFVFAAFVFFVFVVVGVVVCPVSCANTGIASENATANVNSIIKSFFMLGLDLPMNLFPFCSVQGVGHFPAIALDSANLLKYQKLCAFGASQRYMEWEPKLSPYTNACMSHTKWSKKESTECPRRVWPLSASVTKLAFLAEVAVE
jgi:hypothetical protein